MRMIAFARLGGLTCLASLAACDRPAREPQSASAPIRRSGLWDQVLTRDGKPGKLGEVKICIDAATDRKISVFGRHFDRGECQKSVTRDSSGTYRFSSSCKVGNGALVSTRGIATGDFNTGYTMKSDISVSGAPFEPMNGAHTVTMVGKYLGPCPSGMHPGDISLGSGMKITVDELSKVLGSGL